MIDQILLDDVWEDINIYPNSQALINVPAPMGSSYNQGSPYARYELEIATNNLLIPHGIYKLKMNGVYTYCHIKVYKGDTAWGDIVDDPK